MINNKWLINIVNTQQTFLLSRVQPKAIFWTETECAFDQNLKIRENRFRLFSNICLL